MAAQRGQTVECLLRLIPREAPMLDIARKTDCNVFDYRVVALFTASLVAWQEN
jgi:hypothetical protein